MTELPIRLLSTMKYQIMRARTNRFMDWGAFKKCFPLFTVSLVWFLAVVLSSPLIQPMAAAKQ